MSFKQFHQQKTKAIQVHCRLRANPQATTSAKEKDLKPEGLRPFQVMSYALSAKQVCYSLSAPEKCAQTAFEIIDNARSIIEYVVKVAKAGECVFVSINCVGDAPHIEPILLSKA
jgi:hypothetical protein